MFVVVSTWLLALPVALATASGGPNMSCHSSGCDETTLLALSRKNKGSHRGEMPCTNDAMCGSYMRCGSILNSSCSQVRTCCKYYSTYWNMGSNYEDEGVDQHICADAIGEMKAGAALWLSQSLLDRISSYLSAVVNTKLVATLSSLPETILTIFNPMTIRMNFINGHGILLEFQNIDFAIHKHLSNDMLTAIQTHIWGNFSMFYSFQVGPDGSVEIYLAQDDSFHTAANFDRLYAESRSYLRLMSSSNTLPSAAPQSQHVPEEEPGIMKFVPPVSEIIESLVQRLQQNLNRKANSIAQFLPGLIPELEERDGPVDKGFFLVNGSLQEHFMGTEKGNMSMNQANGIMGCPTTAWMGTRYCLMDSIDNEISSAIGTVFIAVSGANPCYRQAIPLRGFDAAVGIATRSRDIGGATGITTDSPPPASSSLPSQPGMTLGLSFATSGYPEEAPELPVQSTTEPVAFFLSDWAVNGLLWQLQENGRLKSGAIDTKQTTSSKMLNQGLKGLKSFCSECPVSVIVSFVAAPVIQTSSATGSSSLLRLFLSFLASPESGEFQSAANLTLDVDIDNVKFMIEGSNLRFDLNGSSLKIGKVSSSQAAPGIKVNTLRINVGIGIVSPAITAALNELFEAVRVPLPQVLDEHTDLSSQASNGGWGILGDVVLPPAPPTPQPVKDDTFGTWPYVPWSVGYPDSAPGGYVIPIAAWINWYYTVIKHDQLAGVKVNLAVAAAEGMVEMKAAGMFTPGFTECPF